MNIVYACSFDLSGFSGKNRATRQKLRALENKVDKLIVISSNFKKFKILELFILDLKAVYFLLKNEPDIFISRGFVGYFSQKVAKYKSIKTVREVHAESLTEIGQLNKSWLIKKALYVLVYFFQKVDNQADMRIFNHPSLLSWYRKNFQENIKDIYVYNGFDFDGISSFSKVNARNFFGFSEKKKYLVFTGSASYWHGVSYLADLQKELNKLGSNVQIVCGGGKVAKSFDLDGLLMNITPLDDIGCADLIQAGDACILPAVKHLRISPGSPLKLYDYILHKKFVITQENLNGYSDEVELYGNGIVVDFNDPANAALMIIDKLGTIVDDKEVDIEQFSWDYRIQEWLLGISKIR
jgi:hypothetical protein